MFVFYFSFDLDFFFNSKWSWDEVSLTFSSLLKLIENKCDGEADIGVFGEWLWRIQICGMYLRCFWWIDVTFEFLNIFHNEAPLDLKLSVWRIHPLNLSTYLSITFMRRCTDILLRIWRFGRIVSFFYTSPKQIFGLVDTYNRILWYVKINMT